MQSNDNSFSKINTEQAASRKKSPAYLSPKLIGTYISSREFKGVLATEEIKKDEILIVWSGEIITQQELENLPDGDRTFAVQIEEGLFLYSSPPRAADWINHSCSPNAGMRGQIVVVSLRDIIPGEEICYDYAMTDSIPYDEFDCNCGSSNCRGRITGWDWQSKSLWTKYEGYFSLYLQRRITRMMEEDAVSIKES